MISPPFRIAVIGLSFTVPHFYFRDEEVRNSYNRPVVRPLFSASASDAHKFHSQEAAVRFRDNCRSLFPKFRFFIERIADGSGPHFENEGIQPEVDSVDRRQALFVLTDEENNRGFVVKPALSPTQGKCWCLRACDVPSLAQVASALETIYSTDPEACVTRALELWAEHRPQPFVPKEIEQRETEELKSFVQQIKDQRHTGFRRRPGDCR